jgi:hypothetical protein
MAWTPILPSGSAAKRDALEVVSLSLARADFVVRAVRAATQGAGG